MYMDLERRKSLIAGPRGVATIQNPHSLATMSVIAGGFHGYPYPATRVPSNGNDLRRHRLFPFLYTLLHRGELPYFRAT